MSAPLINAPGFYSDLSPADYFAEPCPAPALTNSGIRTLLNNCPAKFAHQHPAIGQPAEETKDTIARRLGNLVHRLALGKGKEYALSPYDRYQSKEAKEWKAEQIEAGLIPVKQAEYDQAAEMAVTIQQAIEATCEGHDYQTEVVIAWTTQAAGPHVWCRAMLDVWCPSLNLALDVKTCADASDRAIERAFANGYAGQAAWYADGVEALSSSPERPRFGFLFVENEAPWLGRFAECSESFRHGASLANERAVRIFADCLTAGQWPGYQPIKAQPPVWWLNQITDLELQEAA